jgi:hypothetical protein
MRVKSALANMEVTIGTVSRRGNDLMLRSAAGSAVDTEIAVSAREALAIIGKILTTPGGLLFVLAMPILALRRRSADAKPHAGTQGSVNINKPW